MQGNPMTQPTADVLPFQATKRGRMRHELREWWQSVAVVLAGLSIAGSAVTVMLAVWLYFGVLGCLAYIAFSLVAAMAVGKAIKHSKETW